MKPYIRVAWNIIKFRCIKICQCKNLIIKGLPLLGYNTRMSLSKTSHVEIGKHVISDGRCVIIADHGANIVIGNKVYLNENAMISAKKSVLIGNGCQIGPNVNIFDNDHEFNKEFGVLSTHTSADVEIGDNCWIAANVTILKGTSIGNNCVIGAGCVIKGKIPDGSIVTQDKNIKVVPIESKRE